MNVLGVETSCDETSAAVVGDGRYVFSNVVLSQTDLHAPYGGVVPEIASRSHVESLPDVIREAVVNRSGLTWNDLDAVAVTYGPGLSSSLLVGIAAGKGLALRLNKPLCVINHLEAHIYSLFLGEDAPHFEDVCPFVALMVSGGHTCLVRVEGLGHYILLGQTVDDAGGEAFDKGASLLGLGYPGGPAIEKASQGGKADFVRFPRGRQKKEKLRTYGLDADLCFSFSGLKTALLYYLKEHPLPKVRSQRSATFAESSTCQSHYADGTATAAKEVTSEVSSIAASYQEAIVDALVERCGKAVRDEKYLAAVGGVSLNKRLRSRMSELSKSIGVKLMLAKPEYCADNAAMIAGLAGTGQGIWRAEAMAMDACPNLGIG